MNQSDKPAPDGKERLKRACLVTLMALVPVLTVLLLTHDRNVNKVAFAVKLVPSEQLAIKQVLTDIGMKNFWRTDIGFIQSNIENLGWVEKASVRKVWPDLLVITLSPETSIARWNDEYLLNQAGQVVHTFRMPVQLPHITAPDVFRQFAAQMLAAVQAQLTTVDQLTVDTRGAVTVRLSSGVQVYFGRTDFQLRLARARKALLEREKGRRQIAAIDTRYSGGLAISWQQSEKLAALHQ